jgi:hypothetical protein
LHADAAVLADLYGGSGRTLPYVRAIARCEGGCRVVLEQILVGIVAIVVGLAWAFYGFKAFIILLPIWAFLVGFAAGASWLQELFGEGFFATVTSWVGGLVVGIVLAVLSYFWYYAAVVIVGGALGYTLGAGFMGALGFDGILAIAAGLVVGAILAFITIVLAVPAWLVVVLSAVGGAVAVVNGALILIGRIKLEDISSGLGEGLLKDPLIATIGVIVIAAAGIVYQMRDLSETAASIRREGYRI